MKYYYVICLEEDDDRNPVYVLATHKLFEKKLDAIAYARTVAKSRKPAVLETAYVNVVWNQACDDMQQFVLTLEDNGVTVMDIPLSPFAINDVKGLP